MCALLSVMASFVVVEPHCLRPILVARVHDVVLCVPSTVLCVPGAVLRMSGAVACLPGDVVCVFAFVYID